MQEVQWPESVGLLGEKVFIPVVYVQMKVVFVLLFFLWLLRGLCSM